MKQVTGTYGAPTGHWVGDGFPVRTLFSYARLGKQLSPFLLLDYAGPAHFSPSEKRRGVGEHPHRGFETVTIVYSGEVDHRDSAGNGGSIGPGDVQWMTAGAGLMHEEFHSPAFTRRGGELEMVQLWVNLPAKDKLTPPKYQSITRDMIPTMNLAQGATLRVIAGSYEGARGPASTFTDLNVFDLNMKSGTQLHLSLPEKHNAVVVVLRGKLTVGAEASPLDEAQFTLLSATEADVSISAEQDCALLVLSGLPIEEPIVGYGPFVMNTQEEIVKAYHDLETGQLGRLS
jgi:quercetin 2,3-dioxygenase